MEKFKVIHSQRLGKEGFVNWLKLVVEKNNGEAFICQIHRDHFDRLDNEKAPTSIKLTVADAFEIKPIEGSLFTGLWLSAKKQA